MSEQKEAMKRTMKQPEDRKKEILDGAMHLFAKYGYEQTSMRDIAKALNISLGLCYRYFDSKQKLFNAAMNCYVDEVCQKFILILVNDQIELHEKLNLLYQTCVNEKEVMRYHAFFHQPENKRFHEELSLNICQRMSPYVTEALQAHCCKHHLHMKHEEVFVSFVLYGQIGLQAMVQMPKQDVLETIQTYIQVLLKEVCIPDEQ